MIGQNSLNVIFGEILLYKRKKERKKIILFKNTKDKKKDQHQINGKIEEDHK